MKCKNRKCWEARKRECKKEAFTIYLTGCSQSYAFWIELQHLRISVKTLVFQQIRSQENCWPKVLFSYEAIKTVRKKPFRNQGYELPYHWASFQITRYSFHHDLPHSDVRPDGFLRAFTEIIFECFERVNCMDAINDRKLNSSGEYISQASMHRTRI